MRWSDLVLSNIKPHLFLACAVLFLWDGEVKVYLVCKPHLFLARSIWSVSLTTFWHVRCFSCEMVRSSSIWWSCSCSWLLVCDARPPTSARWEFSPLSFSTSSSRRITCFKHVHGFTWTTQGMKAPPNQPALTFHPYHVLIYQTLWRFPYLSTNPETCHNIIL